MAATKRNSLIVAAIFLIHHLTLWQRFAELLIVQAVRHLAASAFAGVVGVDCFLSKQLFHLLERRLLFAAEKQQRIMR